MLYTYRIFSLTDTIQDISLFLTFLFCRDWEFRAMKIQSQYVRDFNVMMRKISHRTGTVLVQDKYRVMKETRRILYFLNFKMKTKI
jgi:hypothetical protein